MLNEVQTNSEFLIVLRARVKYDQQAFHNCRFTGTDAYDEDDKKFNTYFKTVNA